MQTALRASSQSKSVALRQSLQDCTVVHRLGGDETGKTVLSPPPRSVATLVPICTDAQVKVFMGRVSENPIALYRWAMS